MIIRILGQGQYEVDEALVEYLDEVDDDVVGAVERGNQEELTTALTNLVSHVISHGNPLPEDDLSPSDLILPDATATLAEVKEILDDNDGNGLIPQD
jgi:hypothetical protein